MAPKSQVETYLTQERIQQLREDTFDGVDMKGTRTVDYEYLDRALSGGWKPPSAKHLHAQQASATGHDVHSRISTYLVHAAREFLGEPVGKKSEA
jgi:hypothetical protein